MEKATVSGGLSPPQAKAPLPAHMFRNETKIDSCTSLVEKILGKLEISSDNLIIILGICPEYIQALTHYI